MAPQQKTQSTMGANGSARQDGRLAPELVQLLRTSPALRKPGVEPRLTDIFQRMGGALDRAVEALRYDGADGAQLAHELELVVGLAAITDGNLRLVQTLQEM